jgi:hypothetical protein
LTFNPLKSWAISMDEKGIEDDDKIALIGEGLAPERIVALHYRGLNGGYPDAVRLLGVPVGASEEAQRRFAAERLNVYAMRMAILLHPRIPAALALAMKNQCAAAHTPVFLCRNIPSRTLLPLMRSFGRLNTTMEYFLSTGKLPSQLQDERADFTKLTAEMLSLPLRLAGEGIRPAALMVTVGRVGAALEAAPVLKMVITEVGQPAGVYSPQQMLRIGSRAAGGMRGPVCELREAYAGLKWYVEKEGWRNKALVKKGVLKDIIEASRIPPTADEIWHTMPKKGQGPREKRAHRIQHDVTDALETALHVSVQASLRPFLRDIREFMAKHQRYNSVDRRYVPPALRDLPAGRALELRLSLRVFLAIAPSSQRKCGVSGCHRKLRLCDDDMADPYHMLGGCQQAHGGGNLIRHNGIQSVISRWVEKGGGTWHQPCTVKGSKMDLRICLNGRDIGLDITMTSGTCPGKRHGDRKLTPGARTAEAEKKKMAKHSKSAAAQGLSNVPCGHSTCGGLGKYANSFYETLIEA